MLFCWSDLLLHGASFYVLQVEGPKQDLHSGVYGGSVIEPMSDLIGILGEHLGRINYLINLPLVCLSV